MIIKDLTPEETGRVTGMTFLDSMPKTNIKNELENFIGALEEQNKVYKKKDKNLKEIAAMGDDAFNNFFENQRREKLKKGDN